jgi:hypothetical protein
MQDDPLLRRLNSNLPAHHKFSPSSIGPSTPLDSEKPKFPDVKGFGKMFFGSTLVPPERHQTEEGPGAEPVLIGLGGKGAHDPIHLPTGHFLGQGYVPVGGAQVPIPLWNLIFQNGLITPGVPRKVGDQPVILVPVLPEMREDQVRSDTPLQIFQKLLYLSS